MGREKKGKPKQNHTTTKTNSAIYCAKASNVKIVVKDTLQTNTPSKTFLLQAWNQFSFWGSGGAPEGQFLLQKFGNKKKKKKKR